MMMIFLIFLTAFAMEAIGTYISVVGLGSLFAGDPVILTMACIFDVAKIVSVSFLYQNWQYIKGVMRYYMLSAIIVLMVITSGGVFGYLSGSFQKALQPNMEVSLKVDSYNRERDHLIAERAELQAQRVNIDTQIAGVKSEDVDVKRRLMWSFRPESKRISERMIVLAKRIDELNGMVLKVESENIEKQVHAGPIIYVAKAFDVSIDQAAKWIILTIIFVFDPLAVILILAGNFLSKKRKEEKIALSQAPQPPPQPEPPTFEPPKLPEPVPSMNESILKDAADSREEFYKQNKEVLESIKVDGSYKAPEKMLMVEPSLDSPTSIQVPVDVMKIWGQTPSAEYGQRPEEVSVPYELPTKKTDEFAWLNAVYDDVESGEAPMEDRIPDTLEEPSDDFEIVVEEYIPVEPEIEPEEIEPVIEVQPAIQESSPQAELIEETPNGLNVQELIAAAKKRVNKKRASPTKIEPQVEEKPKYDGPLMTSSLESLKIGTAGAMLGGGHPESHVRNIYE